MKKIIFITLIIFIGAISIVFGQPMRSTARRFLLLFDTPNTYTDQADKILQVNADENAIEFTSLSGLIALGSHTSGNYIETIADAGNSAITVTGSGTEGGDVTLDITDSGITEADLKAVDSATDEDILTKEDTTGDFEWHTIAQMLALTDTDSLSEGSTNLYANTEEEIEDFVGGMLGGTETYISVTYQDGTNDIDFVVSASGVAGAIGEGELANSIVISEDIKNDTIALADMAHEDHGDVTWASGAALLDTGSVADNEIDYTNVTLSDFDYETNWKMWHSDGSGDVTELALGANGTFLESNGVSSAPAYRALEAGDIPDISATYEVQLTNEAGLYAVLSDVSDFVQTSEIDGTGELAAITDYETGSGALVFGTAPTFTTSITVTGADADPTAAGQIRYDSTIAGMSGGGLRWYDDDSVRLLVDLETDPSNDDYVVAYDSTADGFYMKADADSGGATAWDNITDPDAAGTVDFTTHTQTIDIGKSDDGGGDGVVITATGLGAGTDEVVALKITTTANDDDDYVPLKIQDDSGGTPDNLFKFTADGHLYMYGSGRIFLPSGAQFYQSADNYVSIYEGGDTLEAYFDGTDVGVLWSDGALNLRNEEDGVDAIVEIEGKDAGEKGILRVLSDGDDKHIELYHDDTDAYLHASSGDLNLSGSTAVEIPNSEDPDVDAAGEITQDTDGANETGDVIVRGFDGTNQFPIGRKIVPLCACNVIKPNDLADATRDKCQIGFNNSGMTATIVQIVAWSDTDDTAFTLLEFDEDGVSNQSTIDAVNCTTGSGPYTADETTITGPTIEASHTYWVDFDDTDEPGQVFISVWGWYNADVD